MDARLIASAMILCAPLCVSAQQIESLQGQASQEKPEEIVIIGERLLRKQMLAAEVRAYDVFNKFNDEKRFNISCSTKQATGTHFEKQVCAPEFEIQATAAHGQDYAAGLRDNSYDSKGNYVEIQIPTHAPMEVEIARQLPDYKRKIKQVAEQHPEFLDAAKEYGKLRQQYENMTKSAEKKN